MKKVALFRVFGEQSDWGYVIFYCNYPKKKTLFHREGVGKTVCINPTPSPPGGHSGLT